MEKINFKDRQVQYPHRFRITRTGQEGVYTVTPEPGTVTEPGEVTAEMLNDMQDNIEEAINQADETANDAMTTAAAVQAAAERGDFDGATGPQGPKGDKGDTGQDYVLTAQDKADIADLVLAGLPTWTGGSY